ncbi:MULTISPECIES: hypothetical protein [unclassified Microbulbifer]|uniref:hypothetical protein n=1 Tax=unclassified Microbulbifer TaxID=2619833 RepID=UPI0027E4385C|nr:MULTISPECIES: hypothetical protein [unclassified Microbulbifer]
MRALTFWLTFCCASAIFAQNSAEPAEGAVIGKPAADPAGMHKPLHEAMLELLRKNDAVVPEALDVYPYTALYNREAIIPPQCYTRTEEKHNPCYVCHQNTIAERENRMSDGELQLAYSFSDIGMTNHWRNLFEDRRERVSAISDEEILDWINEDNYSALAPRLRAAGFEGWIPDLENLEQGAAAFDEQGLAKDGSGWVAFNYKPLPSTFWPTNGSTDDVMIRLPEVFRTTSDGTPSKDIYKANLAILEANIKGLTEVTTPPIDERVIKADLNGDEKLGVISRINQLSGFVGGAANYYFQPGLYPLDTEFLHTVRYVGVAPDGAISNSRRMKEVRYMKKIVMPPKAQLAELYREEQYAKDAGYLPGYIDRRERGLDNEMGWVIQGFIEDRKGRLRAATFEENMFCMGCHTSVGSTIDKTFSFPRKIDGADGWGYIDLHGMPDAPNRGESKGEIANYFERIGGGDEFRSNTEMLARWFKKDGTLDVEKLAKAKDVYELITPSRERALLLNKAYRTIVADQDFIFGRDATVVPPINVYERIDNETAPTLPEKLFYEWDIRLDWSDDSPSS